jgi:hypothetical protein
MPVLPRVRPRSRWLTNELLSNLSFHSYHIEIMADNGQQIAPC